MSFADHDPDVGEVLLTADDIQLDVKGQTRQILAKIDTGAAQKSVHRVQFLILLVAQHRRLGTKVRIPAIVGELHPQTRNRRRRRRI